MKYPIATTLVCLGILEVTACRPSNAQSIPIASSSRTVRQSDSTIRIAGPRDGMELVVRDSALLRAIWPVINDPRTDRSPVPYVDFSREVLIVIAYGTQPSVGYDIVLDSVVRRFPTTVFYHKTVRSPTCRGPIHGDQAVPAVALRLARPIGDIHFSSSVVTSECK